MRRRFPAGVDGLPASLTLVAMAALIGVACSGDTGGGEAATDAVERALRGYFDAIMTQSRRSFDTLTTEDFLLVQNGHRIDRGRFVETWVEGRPLQTRYRQENVEIEVFDTAAVAELELRWYENRSPVQKEALVGLLRRDGDGWKVRRMHSVTMPLSQPVDSVSLDDYVGSYVVQDYAVNVERRGDKLVSSRPGKVKWVGGISEAELLPGGRDRFHLEITNSLVEFERDDDGAVVRLVLYEPFSNRGFPLQKVRSAPE